MPSMNERPSNETAPIGKRITLNCVLAVSALWLAQPPLRWWPFACVALIPWLHLAQKISSPKNPSETSTGQTNTGQTDTGQKSTGRTTGHWTWRLGCLVWAVSAVYYLISLQGLRHAHPLMIFPTLALAGYLAAYHMLFVILLTRALRRGHSMVYSAPVIWVGLECVRNYLLTGISALMLAHTMADVPIAIQIADLFGSYGVSFVLVSINVALYFSIGFAGVRAAQNALFRSSSNRSSLAAGIACGAVLVAATLGYGAYRLGQPLGDAKNSFALIQRSEPVEYVQSDERAVEIFQAYVKQSQQALSDSDITVDAIVWPESMFSAGLPWMMLGPDFAVPREANASPEEFAEFVDQRRQSFGDRVAYVQSMLQSSQPERAPEWLVGCGVVRYDQQPEVYCGVLQIDAAGKVRDWYGKTHLVMFGEYIPMVSWIPGLRSLVPPGMGLAVGPGPRVMQIGQTSVLPVICIETAVERVVVNQLSRLPSDQGPVDAIVTVTNDGWFDDSSVIEHHLRCGQLVAVATRRPVLSAGNNGPTAWIDSNGRVVERLSLGSDGAIIASPQSDGRRSWYVRFGAWPAWFCVALTSVVILTGGRSRPK
jgi:apolipoprotein N-acyltransferase